MTIAKRLCLATFILAVLALAATLGYSDESEPESFVSVWNTELDGGSDDDEIALPLHSDGDYNFTVDWGDGNQDTIIDWDQPETTHTYESPGTYTVTITGDIEGFRFVNDDSGGPKFGDAPKIVDIQRWGPLRLGNGGDYFAGAWNLEITATDVLELEGTTTLKRGFRKCSKLTTVPSMNEWDTSNVTDMSSMFSGARRFNQDIGDWDVSKVTDMSGMFRRANSFDQDIGDWDVSEVITTQSMFDMAKSFDQDIGGWDVSEVTNMAGMFQNANNFDQDIGGWDVSEVISMGAMFLDASSFDQDIGGWNVTRVINFRRMFHYTSLSTANYDALLTGWSSQDVHSSLEFDGGDSQYSADAEDARQSLIDDHDWTIEDGGLVDAD